MTLHILWVSKILSKWRIFQDEYVHAFYAEIQDGCQKWRENDFWQKVPHACIYPVGQNFVEIALFHTVSTHIFNRK